MLNFVYFAVGFSIGQTMVKYKYYWYFFISKIYILNIFFDCIYNPKTSSNKKEKNNSKTCVW